MLCSFIVGVGIVQVTVAGGNGSSLIVQDSLRPSENIKLLIVF